MLDKSDSTKTFIPAHQNFRVIAIASPVPPYPGHPLDPPFRSRFQARFIDPVGSLLALGNCAQADSDAPCILFERLRDLILSTQYASESRHSLEAVSRSSLPAFPQTALLKLQLLTSAFPPPAQLSPEQLARLVLTIHPALLHAPFQAWATLSRQTEDAGLGALGSASAAGIDDGSGLLGYCAVHIERAGDDAALVRFQRAGEGASVSLPVPAGARPLRPFPLPAAPGFLLTARFRGLLTCFLQAHALGWDIALVPPLLPSTASSSTALLVRVFGEVLGYEVDAVHMYKELGGRELIMRRRIEDGGATKWEPRFVIPE